MEIANKQKSQELILELTSATPHEYKSKGTGITIDYGFARTPFGECFVGGSYKGICMFQFCTKPREILFEELKNEWTNACFHENHLFAEATADLLFTVQPHTPPIKLWLKGTPFQFKVWKTLVNDIPFGTVVSYKELAKLADYPTAVRAVASAVALNPVGYLIPCHRVVRSNGDTGRYHWGADRKKAILEWEKECGRK